MLSPNLAFILFSEHTFPVYGLFIQNLVLITALINGGIKEFDYLLFAFLK